MSTAKFIVRLTPSSTEDDSKATAKNFEEHGGKIIHHHTLFKGFTGEIPTEKISAFEALPHVEAVEQDQKVSIQ